MGCVGITQVTRLSVSVSYLSSVILKVRKTLFCSVPCRYGAHSIPFLPGVATVTAVTGPVSKVCCATSQSVLGANGPTQLTHAVPCLFWINNHSSAWSPGAQGLHRQVPPVLQRHGTTALNMQFLRKLILVREHFLEIHILPRLTNVQ